MMAILAALVSASASFCTPIPGADRLWQPSTRWVLVGELHGTNETPDAFANLVCLAAATNRPITVALEYSPDDQAVVDAYLASDGKGRARSALLRLSTFASAVQDGRGSVAFVRLFDQLRSMKQAGKITGVVGSDVGRSTPLGQQRDGWMAQTWTALPAPPNGMIVAFVGNVHAMRKPMVFPNHTIVTAGSLMPSERTVTVNVVGGGGMAWNCEQDGCGPHNAGEPRAAATGITYSTDDERRWDATYQLGMATTAAAPAIATRSGS